MSPEELAPSCWPEGTSMATVNEHIEKLHAKIKELKTRVAEAEDENLLMEGYDQCLDDMRNVAIGTMEATRALGPIAGLTHILVELEKKDVPVTPPRGVPHDWLSRWKVELAP